MLRIVVEQVEAAAGAWRAPDQGIWEARGEPKHYVSSKLMGWVALDRAARLAGGRGAPGDGRPLARRRRRPSGQTSSSTGSATGASSASTTRPTRSTPRSLLIPLVRFLPSDDERVRATVLAIADELTEHGLVLRYRVDETDDGLTGTEGTFTICSFWLVSALSEIGERKRARKLCERVLTHGTPAGPLRARRSTR